MVLPRNTRAALAAIAALSSLAMAPAAHAVLVPGQGMAGVKLGMTKSEVRNKLGSPRKTITGRNDFGNYTQYRFKNSVRVFFQSGSTVTSIRTTGTRERTRSGIGVGSTEAEIHDKLPKAKCRTLVKNRSCYIGELTPGERVTEFNLRNDEVSWVSVGFVVD